MSFKEFIKFIKEIEIKDKLKIEPAPVELQKPGGFTVAILNDGMTPAEVVVDAIAASTGMSVSDAYNAMMKAHQGGWCPIKSYSSKDMAETVAGKIERHARNNKNYDHYRQHPHFKNFNGPWPLSAEVLEAGG